MRLQKVFIYFIILIISMLTLEARDNPFIPTKTYIDKKAEMVDDSYEYEVPIVDKASMGMMKKSDETMLENGKHNILSFVILEVLDDTLRITTDNQLLKKFDLNYKNTRKIVFDFKSSKGFYTKRAYMDSMNFKYISIGAHPKEGFYRIAISVDDIPSNYDVVYEDDGIHIMKAQM